jgi:alpha-beta hydrolase superfamily lysophospholipase
MLRAMGRDSLVQFGARADTTAGLMDLMDQAGQNVRDIRMPTLVLFGAHEEVLPEAAVTSFLKQLPAKNVRVALYPYGYHMLLRDLHGPIVWKDVMDWTLDRSAKLDSGDECAGAAATSAPCKAR